VVSFVINYLPPVTSGSVWLIEGLYFLTCSKMTAQAFVSGSTGEKEYGNIETIELQA